MSRMETIKADSDLASEAVKLGLSDRRQQEPEAAMLVGRYRYDSQSGHIVGPRGKPLKAFFNKGVWRVGVWHNGRSVSIMVGRLAFALQHGRWPVGIKYLNGDTKDQRAANLEEAVSRALKEARRLAVERGRLALPAVSDQVAEYDERRGKPENYRLAKYRGRDVLAEIQKLRRILKSSYPLTRNERVKLEFALARHSSAWYRCCELAAAYDGAQMACRAPRAPRSAQFLVKPKGPTVRQVRAAGLKVRRA